MNIVKCKNNHFYDGDIYSRCPHCGEQELAGESEQESSKGKLKKKKFGKQARADNSVSRVEEYPRRSEEKAQFKSFETYPQDDDKTEAMDFRQVARPTDETSKSATLDYWKLSVPQSDEAVTEEKSKNISSGDNSDGAGNFIPGRSVNVTESADYAEMQRVKKADEEQSLSEAIKKASANSAGKTMSYFSSVMSEAAGGEAVNVSTDPVVGWLVCVGGKHFGQSFNITTGKNSIGRDETNKIVLSLDNSVSRSKHALITYEPKKRNFYLQPGESSGLTYLNDDYIDESKVLKMKDVIELGESKFIFVPLCDESFTWEDYIKR